MTLALDTRRFSTYARWLLDGSAAYAAWLLADEVEPPHLLGVLMETTDCAAHRATLRCFADPPTIAEESRALCSGIMVTGSSASLPFSPRGLAALARARALALEEGALLVAPAHLLRAAGAELDAATHAEFEQAGGDGALWRAVPAWAGDFATGAVAAPEGSLFARFGEDTKRALSMAARESRQALERSISPARLMLACLALAPATAGAIGLSAARTRALLRGRTVDGSPARSRDLPADDVLQRLVAGWDANATSLSMLSALAQDLSSDLGRLLARNRITVAALARHGAALEDPLQAPADAPAWS